MLSLACKQLLTELPLAGGTPGGMEAYRCSLTVSFFFKFYLAIRLHFENAKVSKNYNPSISYHQRECNAASTADVRLAIVILFMLLFIRRKTRPGATVKYVVVSIVEGEAVL